MQSTCLEKQTESRTSITTADVVTAWSFCFYSVQSSVIRDDYNIQCVPFNVTRTSWNGTLAHCNYVQTQLTFEKLFQIWNQIYPMPSVKQ